MKSLVAILFLVACLPAFGNSQLEQKIASLEARVKALEAKVSGSSTSQNGLRVKDMGNSQMGARHVSGQTVPQLSKKQQEEIQKQLLEFQKRQKEQQEVLKELMHDDL